MKAKQDILPTYATRSVLGHKLVCDSKEMRFEQSRADLWVLRKLDAGDIRAIFMMYVGHLVLHPKSQMQWDISWRA